MVLFNSKSLKRHVQSDDVKNLSPEDLATLKSELFESIEGISQSLAEMDQFQRRHGIPPDEDWQHRAKTKLRICTQFALKIDKATGGAPVLSYKDAYIKRLHEILVEELDPNSLEKIESEAAELARLDVGRD